jgi:hypothetical protein
MASLDLVSYDPVLVDYDLPLEDLIRRHCKLDYWDPDINDKNFPAAREDKERLEVVTAHFNQPINSLNLLKVLTDLDLRALELHEALAFCEQHPCLQCEFPLVISGSGWKKPVLDNSEDGSEYSTPYLWYLRGDRTLLLNRASGFESRSQKDWQMFCRFLVTPKPEPSKEVLS